MADSWGRESRARRGRPKVEVSLSTEALEALDALVERNQFPGRGAAIEWLLRAAEILPPKRKGIT